MDPLRAFTVTAHAAHHATAFMFDNAAAIRAGTFPEDNFLMLHLAAVGFDVSLNGLCHRIGAGQNFVFTETRV